MCSVKETWQPCSASQEPAQATVTAIELQSLAQQQLASTAASTAISRKAPIPLPPPTAAAPAATAPAATVFVPQLERRRLPKR